MQQFYGSTFPLTTVFSTFVQVEDKEEEEDTYSKNASQSCLSVIDTSAGR